VGSSGVRICRNIGAELQIVDPVFVLQTVNECCYGNKVLG